MMILMTKPWLPIEPYLPNSVMKKVMTCSGCLSNCLQISTKLIIAVFLDPIRVDWGGFKTIFDFYANSGLFLLSKSIALLRRMAYRLSWLGGSILSLTLSSTLLAISLIKQKVLVYFSFYSLSFLVFLGFLKSTISTS